MKFFKYYALVALLLCLSKASAVQPVQEFLDDTSKVNEIADRIRSDLNTLPAAQKAFVDYERKTIDELVKNYTKSVNKEEKKNIIDQLTKIAEIVWFKKQ